MGSDAWMARLARPYAHSPAALEASRCLWRGTYPQEPFNLDMAAMAAEHGIGGASEAPAAESRIDYDIIEAAHRQGIFYYDVRPVPQPCPSLRTPLP